jgi:hypothetical protein
VSVILLLSTGLKDYQLLNKDIACPSSCRNHAKLLYDRLNKIADLVDFLDKDGWKRTAGLGGFEFVSTRYNSSAEVEDLLRTKGLDLDLCLLAEDPDNAEEHREPVAPISTDVADRVKKAPAKKKAKSGSKETGSKRGKKTSGS